MSIKQICLKSNLRDYSVVFCETPDFLGELKKTPNAIFIIDNKVWQAHSKGCLNILKDADYSTLFIAEERKTLEAVQEIYDQVMCRAPKKNITLIPIGGGITQDLVGFAASTLYRGVNWIFVPTTLLAQCDSCIGAKTSLNYKQYKNLIGTFYPPSRIYAYIPFLTTQADIDYFSGLGELVKLHLIGGEADAKNIIKTIGALKNREKGSLLKAIQRSLLIKKGYIEEDELDQGKRNILNFGHCFGHAIESASNFSIPHGQAIVIGMILANSVAVKRGLLSKETACFLKKDLLLPVLNFNLHVFTINPATVIKNMKQDKKRTGKKLALVMLTNRYKMISVRDLTEAEALQALKELKAEK